ncbi:MAG: hypothetical protein U9R74_17375 [Pseudomonadota bacterium]|nr:hypothetical protein [Pseudomonadota bacterium]
MGPETVIAHRVRGRVRLRISGGIEDPDYFRELAGKLEALPSVTGVRVNERTGSVVVLHPDVPFSDLEPGFKAIGLPTDGGQGPAVRPAMTPLQHGFSRINRMIAASSSGSVDLRTLFFVGFVLLAIRQILRGNIMAPAIPLLWHAMELVLRFNSGNGDRDA